MARLGCDFLVAGCHKWLFGPRGTGLVWGRRDAWAEAAGTIPAFNGAAIGAWIEGASAGPRRLFDQAASRLRAPLGLAEAFRFHLDLGEREVADRTHALATRLKDGLAAIPAVGWSPPRPGTVGRDRLPRGRHPQPRRGRGRAAARASWPASPLRPALSAPRPQHRHLRGRRRRGRRRRSRPRLSRPDAPQQEPDGQAELAEDGGASRKPTLNVSMDASAMTWRCWVSSPAARGVAVSGSRASNRLSTAASTAVGWRRSAAGRRVASGRPA